jgi:hypothetical protein
VQLELHGLDLLDLVSDGLDPALGAQADVRLDWRRKRAAIVAFCQRVLADHAAVTLSQVAQVWSQRV